MKRPRLRVCILAPELFGWGHHGGAGRAARLLGRELARHSVHVTAIVPRWRGQRGVEEMDGMTVLGYRLNAPWEAAEMCRHCDADIYHSQEPSFATPLAMLARPRRRHVVTIRTLRSLQDWMGELRTPQLGRKRVLTHWLRDANALVWLAVHRAHAAFCTAEELLPLVRARYRRPSTEFMPSPVMVPRRVQKGNTPMVCCLGGWSRSDHPERFFELARSFRNVTFVALGASLDRQYDAELRREYGHVPNVQFVGFVNQFRSDTLTQVLSESWILVHFGSHIGLSDTCVEAAAHRCAILSTTDPDGFASRFGIHVADGTLAQGLDALLAGNSWRERGEQGYEHVHATFDVHRVVERHLAAYEGLLYGPTGGGGISVLPSEQIRWRDATVTPDNVIA